MVHHCTKYPPISSNIIKYFNFSTTSLLVHFWSGGIHAFWNRDKTRHIRHIYKYSVFHCEFRSASQVGSRLWRLKWSSNPRTGINTWQPRPFRNNPWKFPIKWKSKPLYFHNISSQTINTNCISCTTASHRICHMDFTEVAAPYLHGRRSFVLSQKVCLKAKQESLFCAEFLEIS